MDSANTAPSAPLRSDCLYPVNRGHIYLRSRAKSRVAEGKLPHPKRKPLTKAPPPNLPPPPGDVHGGVHCGRDDDTAGSSSSKIHPTSRWNSTATRGRGGASSSGYANGPIPSSPIGKGGPMPPQTLFPIRVVLPRRIVQHGS